MAAPVCPKCGGRIVVGRKNYYCEEFRPTGDPEDCNFIVWKNDLEKFGHSIITEREMVAMLYGETIPLVGLKSPKSGKLFDCGGELVEMEVGDGKVKWKVRLIPDNTNRIILAECEEISS